MFLFFLLFYTVCGSVKEWLYKEYFINSFFVIFCLKNIWEKIHSIVKYHCQWKCEAFVYCKSLFWADVYQHYLETLTLNCSTASDRQIIFKYDSLSDLTYNTYFFWLHSNIMKQTHLLLCLTSEWQFLWQFLWVIY